MELTAHLNNPINISWGATFPAGKFANRPVYFLNEALRNMRENSYLAGLTTIIVNIVFIHLATWLANWILIKGVKALPIKHSINFMFLGVMSSLILSTIGMNLLFNHFFRSSLTPLMSGVLAASTAFSTHAYMVYRK